MSEHNKAATYMDKVNKNAPGAKEEHVQKIVNHLGVTLMNNDAKLVSCSDQSELDRVRDGFCAKKLGMDAASAEKAIKDVCEHMKGDGSQKSRVAFYYLLAKNAGKLDAL